MHRQGCPNQPAHGLHPFESVPSQFPKPERFRGQPVLVPTSVPVQHDSAEFRGPCVRPSVRPSIRPSVCPFFWPFGLSLLRRGVSIHPYCPHFADSTPVVSLCTHSLLVLTGRPLAPRRPALAAGFHGATALARAAAASSAGFSTSARMRRSVELRAKQQMAPLASRSVPPHRAQLHSAVW